MGEINKYLVIVSILFFLCHSCTSKALSEFTVEDFETGAGSNNNNSSSNNNNNDYDNHDSSHNSHHGVSLASWRWDEYSDFIMFILMFILAGLLKLAFHHVPYLSHHLPESCVLICIGVAIGLFVYLVIESHSHHFPQFTSGLFFNVLLPPIILDASYSLYDRDFLANLGSVVLFAVVGTLFNVFTIGYLLYLIYCLGWMGDFAVPLDPISCLVFSSLISAVDPVAVLAIFEEIGVNMSLYFLVFGESLLNDGVTVVLYNTMVALAAQEEIAYSQYVLAFFSFFTVVFGGLIVGVAIGALSSFVLKFTKETRVIEPLVVFATSYLSFILAETIHWSGIISLIGCGIMQKRYAFQNISKKSYTTVKYSVKTLASLSDCIIFLFLGFVTVSHVLEWHTGFVLWTVALCFVIRFVGVYGLSWVTNKRRIKQISLKEQFIMAYGGLRGAVGFSLVTILDEADPFKNIFLTTTLVMIFFTVFVQGGTIKLVVSKLKITRKNTETKMLCHDVNEKLIDHVMAGVESVTGKYSRHMVLEIVRRFDDNYTKKWLIRADAEDLLALRFKRITLDEHYARLYGPAVMILEQQHEHKALSHSVSCHELTEAERKQLKQVLSNTPFERYRHKAFQNDSSEHIERQLKQDQEVKLKLLRRSLTTRRGGGGAGAPSEGGDNNVNINKNVKDADEEEKQNAFDRAEDEKSRLLWKKSMDVACIQQRYREAKEQFRHHHNSKPDSRRSSSCSTKKEMTGGKDHS